MLRTVIIDDKYQIRDTLIKMLEMNFPDVRMVGQAGKKAIFDQPSPEHHFHFK